MFLFFCDYILLTFISVEGVFNNYLWSFWSYALL